MNKQHIKGGTKTEKVLYDNVENQIALAAAKEVISTVQRTEEKADEDGFLYCHVTLHKASIRHTHSPREMIIYCCPTLCLSMRNILQSQTE